MGIQILKEDVPVSSTTTTKADKGTNPRYVVEAVAVQLGLKPSMCDHLWVHYVSMVRHAPLIPCIRCGAASEADMVIDIEGPTFLINRTRTVNREVVQAYRTAREYAGSLFATKESELMIFNGFCEACLMDIEEDLPPALKLAVPENPDITRVRDLLGKALRQGHTYEVIKALRRIVDQPMVDPPDWSTA